MRQRVVIAMALVNDPVLLVADEPTTGLDVVVQVDLAELLSELRAERGMAMLVVSHDLPTVARLADRVLVMSKGRVVEAGDVRDVLGGPRHAATARLVATLPAMPAPVGHDGVRDAGRRSAMAAVTEAVGP
jgi:ABC-type glutathione transport system ATPase component